MGMIRFTGPVSTAGSQEVVLQIVVNYFYSAMLHDEKVSFASTADKHSVACFKIWNFVFVFLFKVLSQSRSC